jgi:hypothetical protein
MSMSFFTMVKVGEKKPYFTDKLICASVANNYNSDGLDSVCAGVQRYLLI